MVPLLQIIPYTLLGLLHCYLNLNPWQVHRFPPVSISLPFQTPMIIRMMISYIVCYIRQMDRDHPYKLDPIIKRHHNPLEERISLYSKDSQLSKFRMSHVSDRHHRTQPSVQNIKEELPKKHSKNRTEFSQEYMSLVNKLRVNLSKQLDKKSRIQVVQERQYLFNNENQKIGIPFASSKDYPKQRLQYYPKESLKISNLKKRSFTTFSKDMEPAGVKSFRNIDSKLTDESFFKNSQEDGFKKEKPLYLPSMNTLKGRYQHTDVIKQVTQQNSPEKPTKNKKKSKSKHQTTKKSKQKMQLIFKSGEYKHNHLTQHHHHQNQDDLSQINEDYPKIDQLCFHIQVIVDILQKLNSKDNIQQSPDRMIRILKDYVLGNKKSVNSGSQLLQDDISHLDRIYKQQKNQKQLRNMVFYQRILIIFCIDLLASRTINTHLHEISHILHSLLGIYLYFIYLFKQTKNPMSSYALNCLDTFQVKTSEHNIHVKKQIQTAVFFISKKLFPILKTNPVLFRQIKVLVVQFESRNVTINRSFYELLRLYAIYLNNHEGLLQKHYQALKTFATCPSPYLTKPSPKPYTLVLDLDQTLIHSHRNSHRLEIFMRPFLKEFLEVMDRNFQIVVFTSSLPDYAEEIIGQLPFVAHRLYRHHTTRLKHRHIKDLSRLGRSLQTVVMVDNEEENFVLQKSNGIKIAQWTGDDPQDQQLNILGVFLNELAEKSVTDIRDHLPSYKQFRHNYQR